MGSNLESTFILIADDNEVNRLVFSKMIEVSFPEITTMEASNGQTAFIACLDKKPALILMDLNMPVLNGYEATKKIRAEKNLKEIPIIAITGASTTEEMQKGYDVGITDFLIKPVAAEQLDLMVNKYLNKQKKVAETKTSKEDAKHVAYEVLLESLGNDEETTQEVLKQANVFLEYALEDIKKYLAEKDLIGLKLHIHQMRGVAANARFGILANGLKNYEDLSTIEEYKSADFFGEIEKEIFAIKKQLISYLR